MSRLLVSGLVKFILCEMYWLFILCIIIGNILWLVMAYLESQ